MCKLFINIIKIFNSDDDDSSTEIKNEYISGRKSNENSNKIEFVLNGRNDVGKFNDNVLDEESNDDLLVKQKSERNNLNNNGPNFTCGDKIKDGIVNINLDYNNSELAIVIPDVMNNSNIHSDRSQDTILSENFFIDKKVKKYKLFNDDILDIESAKMKIRTN